MTRSSRVLITDAESLAGLGAVRSLGRAGYTVIAATTHDKRRPASSWSRYAAARLTYPDAWVHQMAFRDWIREQARRDTYDWVLPISEAAVAAVAAVRHELPEAVTALIPSDAALAFTLSKYRATRKALALGIRCPTTVFVSDGTSLAVCTHDLSILRFPVVIKSDNYVSAQGAYHKGETFYAATMAHAAAILRELRQRPTGVIAQAYIPGGGAGAFLLRCGGRTSLRFAHRRLHEVPYTGGYSSYRESCHDPELLHLGEQILHAIDYDGVAMVEFRRGLHDNQLYFLEINGRLWGSLALALHCGVDFPRALLESHQNGRPYGPVPSYRAGIRCRNLFPGEVDHLTS
ncbi:MAG: hypothetical protein OEU26_26395, partial [Candidatus Tectomicrobia bacterium]|nr:hypothetical protein [Candidatus Tectomicrobia bacterium]